MRSPSTVRRRAPMALAGSLAVALALASCSSGKTSATSPAATTGTASPAPSSTGAAVSSSSAAPAASDSGSASAGSPSASGGLPPESDVAQFQQAEPGSGAGVTVGLIALDESVPFSKLVSDGIKKQAATAGAKLVFCDSKGDGATALACAQNFKVQGVQGYLNFQSDAKVADSICTAGPSGPVIAIDIQQGKCQTSFMGANNAYAGYVAGRALGEYLKTKSQCDYDAYVSMEEPAAGQVNEDRMGGYRKGFSEVCGPIKNLKKENAFRLDAARTTFTDVLTTLPNAHRIVVVAINDDAIEGALAAAKTANRTSDLFVSGQGADPSAWCAIKTNPQWVGDTGYFPERYGEIGVPNLLAAIKGKVVPKNLLVPHQIISGANIDSIYHPTGC